MGVIGCGRTSGFLGENDLYELFFFFQCKNEHIIHKFLCLGRVNCVCACVCSVIRKGMESGSRLELCVKFPKDWLMYVFVFSKSM